MNNQEIIKRLTQLHNRTFIPHCSIAEEAKKLKSDGEVLEINNGSLQFSGPIIGSNITATNNLDIQKKADKGHTHTTEDITDYEPYDDTELKGMINDNTNNITALESNKADKEHTHKLADITDYEIYNDDEVRELINGKADATHTHAISEITSLQSSLNSKLNTSEFNKLNQHIKTYRIRSDYRFNNGAQRENIYHTFAYIKNVFTGYKGFMVKFDIALDASNNAQNTIFETAEVCIGHVQEQSQNGTKIHVSSCYRKIGLTDRSVGIGLRDINGDNSVYQIELVAKHHFGYDRLNFNITCEADTRVKLYSDAECTKELSITSTLPDTFHQFDDYSIYQSYALSETPHAPKVHTHTTADITDYEPYDDTELKSLVNDNETRLKALEEMKYVEEKWVYKGPVSETNVVYNITYKGSLNDKKGGEVSIDETLNTPIITFAKTNIPSLVNVYKDGLIIASIANYSVSGPNASWFYVIDKFTIQYTRDDENYDDTLIFKSTTSSGNFEDSYNISKSTQTTYTTKWNDNRYIPTISYIRDWLYPVGSIYTSMNNVDPAHLFGGTWKQIKDRFLYCADSSLQTGGSKNISVEQLPAHKHTFNDTYYLPADMSGYPDGWDDTNSKGSYWRYGKREESVADTTADTGNGAEYMPPYMTVYAWYRTA